MALNVNTDEVQELLSKNEILAIPNSENILYYYGTSNEISIEDIIDFMVNAIYLNQRKVIGHTIEFGSISHYPRIIMIIEPKFTEIHQDYMI